MRQFISLSTLVVRDYDEALAFYVGVLGFTCVQDIEQTAQAKRWVVVMPPGAKEGGLLLARATDALQAAAVGRQTGGRVAFFLFTDDFARDHARYQAAGVRFVQPPRTEPYGTVAVFEDLYGNLWDLLEPAAAKPATPETSASSEGDGA
jgi:catechol 2,3-dioxygenase-like lactoylglutathione lyase family enzyme